MKKTFLTFFLFIFSFVNGVHAQEFEDMNSGTASSPTLGNPLGNNIQDIPSLVEAILDIALTVGVPIIALAIIYAGFKFISAQGNKDKLEEAKKTILYVFIGAAILLAAYAIATAIVSTIASIRG
jgi:hypothetical protein